MYKNELDKNGYNSDKLFDIIQKGGHHEQLIAELEKQKDEIIKMSNSINLHNENDFNNEIDELRNEKQKIIEQYKYTEDSLTDIIELLTDYVHDIPGYNHIFNGLSDRIGIIVESVRDMSSRINEFTINDV